MGLIKKRFVELMMKVGLDSSKFRLRTRSQLFVYVVDLQVPLAAYEPTGSGLR